MKTFSDYIFEAVPTDKHLAAADKHDAASKTHSDIASKIRAGMKGADYASTVMSGEVASHHEFASRLHATAAKHYRAGDAKSARVNATSAALASERANKKGV